MAAMLFSIAGSPLNDSPVAAGATALELMRNADIAMYDAKRQGTGRYSIFTAAMHRHVLDQIELETELRAIIEERRLRVFYQPIVDLVTGEIAGFEALARWPEHGEPVSPARFVAVAEDTGQIADLGQLVLQEACERLASWRARGIVGADLTVSVNVSGRQLSDPRRLVDDVQSALSSSGLPPTCLRLEITESTVISRPERARQALDELARLGVRAEIDDFGTGYASLTVLQSFVGDTLKIDRSFIGTMHEDDGQRAIVRGIVALAHKLERAPPDDSGRNSGASDTSMSPERRNRRPDLRHAGHIEAPGTARRFGPSLARQGVRAST